MTTYRVTHQAHDRMIVQTIDAETAHHAVTLALGHYDFMNMGIDFYIDAAGQMITVDEVKEN